MDKIGFITTDNASNNDTFFRNLGILLEIQNPEEMHVRCACHILNLITQTFLKETPQKEDAAEETTEKRKKGKRKSYRPNKSSE